MPNETRECQGCHVRFPRESMIRIADYRYYCAPCHVNLFVACTDCGARIQPSYAVYDLPGDAARAEPLCYNCLNQRTYWDSTPSNASCATYTRMGSRRKYGVEIETASCEEYRSLRGQTLFGIHTDGSISGLEFVSPILYGDEGLTEIEILCNYARQKNWSVDSHCGLHIHLDMRDETNESLIAITTAYVLSYEVWRSFVSERRTNNHYCHSTPYTVADIASGGRRRFADWAYDQTRFSWFNVAAYGEHQTFENRLMKGTINPELICNWIAVNARFADWAADKSRDSLMATFNVDARTAWRNWKNIIGDATLNRYFGRMRRRRTRVVAELLNESPSPPNGVQWARGIQRAGEIQGHRGPRGPQG